MNLRLFMKRHSSTVLSCLGAAGVIATSIMVAKATPKAITLLKKAEMKKGDQLTKTEEIKTVARVYIPSVLVGASTIACILGANVLNKRTQANLVSAYALLDTSFKEYKAKVADMYGSDADRKITAEIVKDDLRIADISVKEGNQLFYDFYSGRYFESTTSKVICAEYALNRCISMKGYAYLNDWYDELGIDPIDAGVELGWSKEACLICYKQTWVDFHHELVELDEDENDFGYEGLECIIVYMAEEPLVNCEFIGH